MRLEAAQWNDHSFEIFRKYFDIPTLRNVMGFPLLAIVDGDEIVGYFTFAKGNTFDNRIIIEIRHMAGSFNPADLYDELQQWAHEEDAAIRVVSDRPGFDKICSENGFKKVSTIWELE